MYKVIWENKIIDVIDKPRYVRYIKRANKFVLTDVSSAHGIYSSNNKTIYTLQGKQTPATLPNKKVQLVEIDKLEASRLLHVLQQGEVISSNLVVLQEARNRKIAEMSKACNTAIINGFDVLLSDGFFHHFKLTIEDQINLNDIKQEIDNGAKSIVYHETGKICHIFSSEDFAKLYKQAYKHKRYHTTYFNILKYCINNVNDIDKINDIKYGDDITSFGLDPSLTAILEEV